LELEWGSQPSFCEYVSVSAKPSAIPLLKVMQRSQPAKRSRQPVWTRDVLVVKGIRWAVSQSAVAIELAQRKWLGRSQTLIEKIWCPYQV
jgi:hypothetical protein